MHIHINIVIVFNIIVFLTIIFLYLFVSLSVCLSVSFSISLSVYLCLSLSLCLSVSLSLSLSLSWFSWFLNGFRIIQHCNTCSVSLLKMKFGGTKKTGCSTLSWFRIFENSLFMKASTAAKSSVSNLPFPRFQKYLIPEF